ncbi:hypothetical protein BaRGS_00007969, partial [Batillaria attramentaria]
VDLKRRKKGSDKKQFERWRAECKSPYQCNLKLVFRVEKRGNERRKREKRRGSRLLLQKQFRRMILQVKRTWSCMVQVKLASASSRSPSPDAAGIYTLSPSPPFEVGVLWSQTDVVRDSGKRPLIVHTLATKLEPAGLTGPRPPSYYAASKKTTAAQLNTGIETGPQSGIEARGKEKEKAKETQKEKPKKGCCPCGSTRKEDPARQKEKPKKGCCSGGSKKTEERLKRETTRALESGMQVTEPVQPEGQQSEEATVQDGKKRKRKKKKRKKERKSAASSETVSTYDTAGQENMVVYGTGETAPQEETGDAMKKRGAEPTERQQFQESGETKGKRKKKKKKPGASSKSTSGGSGSS